MPQFGRATETARLSQGNKIFQPFVFHSSYPTSGEHHANNATMLRLVLTYASCSDGDDSDAPSSSSSSLACCLAHICAYAPPETSNCVCVPRSMIRPCSSTRI